MQIPKIPVEPRKDIGTRAARRFRAEGKVPSVLYGHRRDPQPLTVAAKTIEGMLKSGARMVDLSWGKEGRRAIIKDVQFDHMGDDLVHVDFQEIAMDEVIHLRVAIEFEGVPKGVKEGGVVEYQTNDVEIKCLPANIPEKLVIQIAELNIGDSIHVGQIALPPGVSLLDPKDKDLLAVTVALPRVVAEPVAEAAPEEAPAGPEIISQKEREDREKAKEEATKAKTEKKG